MRVENAAALSAIIVIVSTARRTICRRRRSSVGPRRHDVRVWHARLVGWNRPQTSIESTTCSGPATWSSSTARTRLSYLHSQVSQDLQGMTDGERRWTFVLEPTGKVESLARVTKVSDERYELDTDAGWGPALLARIDRFKIRVRAETTLVPADGDVVRSTTPPASRSVGRVSASRSWRARRSRPAPGSLAWRSRSRRAAIRARSCRADGQSGRRGAEVAPTPRRGRRHPPRAIRSSTARRRGRGRHVGRRCTRASPG
jgi:hypothetical protein